MSIFCHDLHEGRVKKEIPFKLHTGYCPVLNCGTVPRPTPKSLSFVKATPIIGERDPQKEEAVPLVRALLVAAASIKGTEARMSRGSRVPARCSSGRREGASLGGEALDLGWGVEGHSDKALSSPFTGAFRPGVSRSPWWQEGGRGNCLGAGYRLTWIP